MPCVRCSARSGRIGVIRPVDLRDEQRLHGRPGGPSTTSTDAPQRSALPTELDGLGGRAPKRPAVLRTCDPVARQRVKLASHETATGIDREGPPKCDLPGVQIPGTAPRGVFAGGVSVGLEPPSWMNGLFGFARKRASTQ